MAEMREVFEMATKEMKPDQSSRNDQQRRQRRRARNRRVVAFAVVAVVLLAVGAFGLTQMNGNDIPGSGQEAPPSVSPTSASVVGTAQPVIVGLDGTARRLHGIPADAESLNMSPDGRQIVFVADQNGSPQIGTVGVDGSGLRFITQVTSASIARGTLHGPFTPVWSPDGSRIAFSNGHIYVVNADGSGLTQLTSGAGVDQWPSWSPDGSTIAYSDSGTTLKGTSPLDDNAQSDTMAIWTVPLAGGGPTRLTQGVGSNMPAYSPDGTRIAFANGAGGISFMDANGQNARGVYPPAAGLVPRWSPDGSRLVYVQSAGTYAQDGGPLLRAYVVDISTGGIHRIPGSVDRALNAVQWLPTGRILQNRYTG